MNSKSASILLAALSLVSCTDLAPHLRSCPAISQQYFRGQSPLNTEAFEALPLPEQYEVYVCGQQYVRPRRLPLATAFAEKGAPAIFFLADKLRASSDDRTTRDIIVVFAEAQRGDFYDVAGDQALMSLLRNKARSMRDRHLRVSVHEMIDAIERQV